MIEPNLDTPIYRQVNDRTYGQLVDVGYLHAAVAYVHSRGIPGAIVECGVWRGGMLKAALLACELVGTEREVWGYDTFTGMTAPNRLIDDTEFPAGALAVPEQEVRDYLGERVRLVAGDVKETAARERPEQIAILRLDVDWWDNTMACLKALWPRLSPGGVLLVDDYPHWKGCVAAVDEFLGDEASRLVRTGTGSGMLK